MLKFGYVKLQWYKFLSQHTKGDQLSPNFVPMRHKDGEPMGKIAIIEAPKKIDRLIFKATNSIKLSTRCYQVDHTSTHSPSTIRLIEHMAILSPTWS